MIYLKDFGGKTLHNMVIMWISGDQEPHSAVHTGGVGRGKVRGCGCWR